MFLRPADLSYWEQKVGTGFAAASASGADASCAMNCRGAESAHRE